MRKKTAGLVLAAAGAVLILSALLLLFHNRQAGERSQAVPEELVGKTCIAITNLPPRPMMGIDSCGMLISAVHHENGEEKLHLLMVDPHIPAGAKLY